MEGFKAIIVKAIFFKAIASLYLNKNLNAGDHRREAESEETSLAGRTSAESAADVS